MVGRVVVIDPHPIFRRGLLVCIGALDGVDRVDGAASVAEAHERELVEPLAVVVIDHVIDGAHEFMNEVASLDGARVIVCSDDRTDAAVLASVEAGAIAFLVKRTMQPETLGAALLAVAGGNGFLAADLMPKFINRPDEGLDREPASLAATMAMTAPPTPLTEREHRVLALIADGEPTREVARQLCYSERTVKNVLHDIVVKLGARSRSQAVAHAVRHELI